MGGFHKGGRRGGEGREGRNLRTGCAAHLRGERSEGRRPFPLADQRKAEDERSVGRLPVRLSAGLRPERSGLG